MSARFTPKMRSFVSSGFIESMIPHPYNLWEANKNYNTGDQVYYGNNIYVCKQTGTSGINVPVHIFGSSSDGSIDWIFIGFIQSGNVFKRNLYISLGKISSWEDEANPDYPQIFDIDEQITIDNIISMKKIGLSNFRLACRHYKWESGTVYSQYSDKKDPLAVVGPNAYSSPFYVITDNDHVYKCINNNNNSESVIKPTGTSLFNFSTIDNYIWKFMGDLDITSTYFKSSDFFPVNYRSYNDNSAQYNTQTYSVKNSLSTFNILQKQGTFLDNGSVSILGGSPITPASGYITKDENNLITQILVNSENQGLDYDYSQRVIAIAKNQNDSAGSGASIGTITVTDGIITNIAIDQVGNGYTNGAILLLNDREGTPITPAVIEILVSGIENMVQEINIINGGSGYSDNIEGYIIGGNAGALGEGVFAPKEGHGNNIITELGVNAIIVNLRISDLDNYFLVGETNPFRQVCLITDIIEKDTLNTCAEIHYIGPSHPNYGEGILNEIDDNRGHILYVNNLQKVVRSNGQEEEISIVLTF